MSIILSDIPLLEYDNDPSAVVLPTHDELNCHLPRKCVFAFLGDYVDEFAHKQQAKVLCEFESSTKSFPVYAFAWHGAELCLVQAPVGAAAAAQFLDFLIGYGVEQIIAVGSCGALVELEESSFIIPTRALRDEGLSYHYLPAQRYISLQAEPLAILEQTLQEAGYEYQLVTTWTTDGFYRETAKKVKARVEEGCQVVEMECSALAAVAEFRQVSFAQLLFTADTLADISAYDERDWGESAYAPALSLSLEAVCNLP